jgi:hypothetical protein
MTTIYNVSIAAYTVDTSQQQNLGFVDNTTPAQYLAAGTQPSDFDLSHSLAKVQGNLRWKFILQSMALMANPYVSNIVATGAAMDTDATTFAFDVYFERDAAVTTTDASGNVLTGSAAVQYVVAEVMATTYNAQVSYYDPTKTNSLQNGVTVTADYCDQRIGQVTAGALAADMTTALSKITVTVVA